MSLIQQGVDCNRSEIQVSQAVDNDLLQYCTQWHDLLLFGLVHTSRLVTFWCNNNLFE